jgi:tetratricopeptide (TPR) repeat protein
MTSSDSLPMDSQPKAISFPMGPQMRNWLGISEQQYCGHLSGSPTAEQIASFSQHVVQHLEDATPRNTEHLVDLIEELVGMNMPLLALKLADAYPNMFPRDDFRANLHVGNAAMLVGDLAKAELMFIQAQRLVPEEPAPYVNLTQIYCHDEALDQAKQWCITGLQVDPDHLRLWEMLAWIEQNQSKQAPEIAAKTIAHLAKTMNSWAGTSLACDLMSADDPLVKLTALEKFWDEGLRDDAFLIEWTAVLGMAGRYDRIPPIVWATEATAKPLPWQVLVHLAQSYLGLGRDTEALATLDRLSSSQGLPNVAHQSIAAMRAEIKGTETSH